MNLPPLPDTWYPTHEVTNQATPLAGYDAAAELPLLEGLEREGAGWYSGDLHALGRKAGTAEWLKAGDDANAYPPKLLTHDRYGHRIDEVEFHPSWHALVDVAVTEGMSGALAWSGRPGAHVARAAAFSVWSQVESGYACPISMTYAAVPALRTTPAVAEELVPLLTSGVYEPSLKPLAQKRGALSGMGMTEKQGGSDVRTNTTTATPVGEGAYVLRGHKWFTSAPMCDMFLFLAQAPGGLSCFVVPRVLPDGTRNRLHLQRLKDKLGNRSNASSEVELNDALGILVGEEGRGVRTIISMVALTRLDCVIGSTSLQRVALSNALHHTRHRAAFGRTLADQPLMKAVLADLALESEAATALMLRLAGAVDRGEAGDERERAFGRIATAVGKYWVCKRTPGAVGESLECLGGNGYVEESRMPRYYREAPLLSIWEGSGNVNALDVLRAMSRAPETVSVLRDELEQATGVSSVYDEALRRLDKDLTDLDGLESRARGLVERTALLLQASVLLRHSPVGEAFVAARLGPDASLVYGGLPRGLDVDAIVARAAAGLPA
ncbi:MAG TPA: acyl-CoA dehydrogenase family protein [Mycobacteriales bacterium]|jgi:putative acyl-CoA dehydrogenase